MKVFLNPSTELDIERMTAPINGMSLEHFKFKYQLARYEFFF